MAIGPLEFTEFELDALKEIGNIGAGNAATALSQMVGRRIDLSISKVNFLSTDSIGKLMGGAQTNVAAVYLPFYGDIKGIILIFFSVERAFELSQMLTGSKPHSTEAFSDMEKSAIRELCSILTGAYLGALFKFIHLQVIHGVPTLILDMAQAILDTVLVELENQEEAAIFIKTELIEHGKQITGSFFLIPEAGGLAKLFSAFHHSLGLSGNG